MSRLLAATIVIAGLSMLGSASSTAAEYQKSMAGLSVYLGVLPSELVLGHSPEHPEKQMHGGVPRGKGWHHVLIALVDTETGQRVSDAAVSARVQEVGLGATAKKLEPMTIDKTISFGNYFPMSGPGPYRIEIDIRRPRSAKPLNVSFDYSHPRR